MPTKIKVANCRINSLMKCWWLKEINEGREEGKENTKNEFPLFGVKIATRRRKNGELSRLVIYK